MCFIGQVDQTQKPLCVVMATVSITTATKTRSEARKLRCPRPHHNKVELCQFEFFKHLNGCGLPIDFEDPAPIHQCTIGIVRVPHLEGLVEGHAELPYQPVQGVWHEVGSRYKKGQRNRHNSRANSQGRALQGVEREQSRSYTGGWVQDLRNQWEDHIRSNV